MVRLDTSLMFTEVLLCAILSDLKPLLTPEAVTELVMATMKSLPLRLPKAFRNSYTPIAAAGTDAQVCAVNSDTCHRVHSFV